MRRQDYEVLEEYINVAFVNDVIEFLCRRNMKSICKSYNWDEEDVSLVELLQSFVSRACNVTDGVGTIVVVWTNQTTSPGLLGRRCSGIRGMSEIPPELAEEARRGISHKFRGISAFKTPRPARAVLRHDLHVMDVDGINMMFNSLKPLLSRLSIPLEYPKILEYLARRDEVRDMVMRGLSVSKDDAKEIILVISNGGGLTRWAEEHGIDLADSKCRWAVDWLQGLQDEMDSVMTEVYKRATPEQRQFVSAKPRPCCSHFSHTWMAEERAFLDFIIAVGAELGVRHLSYEHDGACFVQCNFDFVEAVNERSDIKVALKPAPEDPLGDLMIRYDLGPKTGAPPGDVLLVSGDSKLLSCAPFLVKGGCSHGKLDARAQDPRGQAWRLVKVVHSTPVGQVDHEKVALSLHLHMGRCHHFVSVGSEIIVLFKFDGVKSSSKVLQLPEGLPLMDAMAEHVTLGVPGQRKDGLMINAVRDLKTFGVFVAGNIEYYSQPAQAPLVNEPEWKDVKEYLIQFHPDQWTDLLANAILAVNRKKATPYQKAIKLLQGSCQQFMEFRAKMGLGIRPWNDGPIYPDKTIPESIRALRFTNLREDRQLEELTIEQVFDLRPVGEDPKQLELVYRKAVNFVGGSGQGKTELSKALARRACVRQGAEIFYETKGNFDGFGMLTREGLMNKFGAIVLGDFTWTYGQKESLDMESRKGILRTEEIAEHKARFYNGRWPAEVARLFSSNHDKDDGGNIDVGYAFEAQLMPALAALARKDQKAIDDMSDDQIAMARSCVMCVIPKDLKLMEGNTRTKEQTDKAAERRARQKAFEARQSASADQ